MVVKECLNWGFWFLGLWFRILRVFYINRWDVLIFFLVFISRLVIFCFWIIGIELLWLLFCVNVRVCLKVECMVWMVKVLISGVLILNVFLMIGVVCFWLNMMFFVGIMKLLYFVCWFVMLMWFRRLGFFSIW